MLNDYTGLNLQSRCFANQDLANANFTNANLKGANFKGANLTGATFHQAQTGISKIAAIGIHTISIPLLLLAAFTSGFACVAFSYLMHTEMIQSASVLPALFALFLLACFTGINWYCNFWRATVSVIALCVSVVIIVIPLTVIAIFANWGSRILEIAIAILVGGIVVVGAMIAAMIAIACVVCATHEDDVGSNFAYLCIVGISLVFTADILSKGIIYVMVAALFVLLLASVGRTIGKRAATGRDAQFIREITSQFTSIGGTSFYQANLTDADFTGANLKHADFRSADLTRTCWRDSTGWSQVRFNQEHLKNISIRRLLIRAEGQNQDFSRCNLQRLNLQNANLFDTLLVQAQLEHTNLAGAILTGACIDGWTLSPTTNLQHVDCEYVYLKWIAGQKQHRLPLDRNFEPEEFTEYIQSILNTIDLAHDQTFDPRAVVLTLQELSEQYRQPLEIVALEKRGRQFVLKLKYERAIASEQFEQDYFKQYTAALNSLAGVASLAQLEESVKALKEWTQKIETEDRVIIIGHLENRGGIVVTGGQTTIHYTPVSATNQIDLKQLKQLIQANIQNLPQVRRFAQNYQRVLINLCQAIEDSQLMPETQLELFEGVQNFLSLWGKPWDKSAQQQFEQTSHLLTGTTLLIPEAKTFSATCARLLPALKNLLKSANQN